MTKIDLITGFLGSGKTTFLKKYVNHFLQKGERICILEFDYGAINVDMMLLQEFNDRCDLEMVAGGCDYNCHLRRFKTKLIAMGMKKYDRVIVEPSGIFDPDEFFDTLYEEPLDQWYEIGSVISIVDSGMNGNLSDESKYILMSQIAASGRVVLSKTQLHSDDEIEESVSYITQVMKEYNLSPDKDRITIKNFNELSKDDIEMIAHSSYRNQSHEKRKIFDSNKYESVYFMNTGLNLKMLTEKANIMFNDESYGKIIRVKGFIEDENTFYEFNKTKNELSLEPVKEGQEVIIVIGEQLNQGLIENLIGPSKI